MLASFCRNRRYHVQTLVTNEDSCHELEPHANAFYSPKLVRQCMGKISVLPSTEGTLNHIIHFDKSSINFLFKTCTDNLDCSTQNHKSRTWFLQVEFLLFGVWRGFVGLRGNFEVQGDGQDTVKVWKTVWFSYSNLYSLTTDSFL